MRKYILPIILLIVGILAYCFYSTSTPVDMKKELFTEGGAFRFEGLDGKEFRYYTISDIIAYNMAPTSPKDNMTSMMIVQPEGGLGNNGLSPLFINDCSTFSHYFQCDCPTPQETNQDKMQKQIDCAIKINGDPSKCDITGFWEAMAATKLINAGRFKIKKAKINGPEINIPGILTFPIGENPTIKDHEINFPGLEGLQGKKQLTYEIEFENGDLLNMPFNYNGKFEGNNLDN